MHRVLQMRKQDLLELYQLLTLYQKTYECSGKLEWLMQEIEERYWENPGGRDIRKDTNPRNAGRRKKYTEKDRERIRQLHQEGKTVRAIASETGCSIGYVQGIIKTGKAAMFKN